MLYDLHCHTTASDGSLNPTELLSLAIAQGIDYLAITDHDTVAAHHSLLAEKQPVRLITGIELSCQWRGVNIHIVGLNFALNSDAITTAVENQQQQRRKRAETIAEKLAKLGLESPLEGALKFAGGGSIGRPHFARYMVDCGFVDDMKQAFKKYLGSGKPGDVKQLWPTVPEVTQWIRDAGGIPVLAHPAKYKLTYTKLGTLCDSFIEAGGQGIEVSSGLQPATVTQQITRLCEQKQLLASAGSDFHQPGQHWAQLGSYSPLPAHLKTVWQHF